MSSSFNIKPFVLSEDGKTVTKTPTILEQIIESKEMSKSPMTLNEYECSYNDEKIIPKHFCVDKTVFSKPVFVLFVLVTILLMIGIIAVLGYFLGNKVASKVFTKSGYNDECLMTSQCVDDFVCASRKCQCPSSLVYNGVTCGRHGRINASCSLSESCDRTNVGLVCIDSKCVCYPYAQYYDSTAKKCVDYVKENDPCDPEPCNPYLSFVCKCPGSSMGLGCRKCEKVP